ncbi:MAG: methyltransferase type 12 [Bacteriovoracaceae bacterium]|nr:methyltransferase type 12 [Bacteriovoracaceae bacterium]
MTGSHDGSLDSFKNLSFEKFRERAKATDLNESEKIGFPSSYREGKEKGIFEDIFSKLNLVHSTQKKILDLGCGCSELPRLIVSASENNAHKLTLIDSREMLQALGSTSKEIESLPGYFPKDFETWIEKNQKTFDAIIAYSLFHYIRAEGIEQIFLEACLKLLKPGGELLLGDIPNFSMKLRFLKSEEGKKYHEENFGKTSLDLSKLKPEPGHLDDDSLQALIRWFKDRHCNVFLLPQPKELPFSNRREDLLIKKL